MPVIWDGKTYRYIEKVPIPTIKLQTVVDRSAFKDSGLVARAKDLADLFKRKPTPSPMKTALLTLGIGAALAGGTELAMSTADYIRKKRAVRKAKQQLYQFKPEFKKLPSDKKKLLDDTIDFLVEIDPTLASHPTAVAPIVSRIVEYGDVGITPDVVYRLSKAREAKSRESGVFTHSLRTLPVQAAIRSVGA